MVIGVVSFSEMGTPVAIDVPSKENLLQGTDLSVLKPGGNQITDPDLTQRIADELERLLGGWFAGDLTSYIQLYDSLVSLQLQEYYRAGGMGDHLDEPEEAFYNLAFAVPPWQVQVVGEPGD